MDIKLSDTTPAKCDCGCSIFNQHKHFRQVPGLLVGQKDAMILEFPFTRCANCNKFCFPSGMPPEVQTAIKEAVAEMDTIKKEKTGA